MSIAVGSRVVLPHVDPGSPVQCYVQLEPSSKLFTDDEIAYQLLFEGGAQTGESIAGGGDFALSFKAISVSPTYSDAHGTVATLQGIQAQVDLDSPFAGTRIWCLLSQLTEE